MEVDAGGLRAGPTKVVVLFTAAFACMSIGISLAGALAPAGTL